MSDFVLQDDQTVACSIVAMDDAGNAVPGAALDAGSGTATVSDDTVLTAELSDDGSSLQITAEGPEATGVTVTVEGTLNGNAVSASLVVDVSASPATGIGLLPGTPTHK